MKLYRHELLYPKKTPHILYVSPLYVPMANAEAFCSGKMAMTLSEAGYDVTVLCRDINAEEPFDSSALWKRAIPLSIGIAVEPNRKRFTAIKMGVRLRTLAAPRFISKIVKTALNINRDRPFDLIYSRSLPYSAHVAGYYISKALNIPWIANINDAWDNHLSLGLESKVPFYYSIPSYYWLRKTIMTADLVTYPSTRLRKYLSKLAKLEERGENISHIGMPLIGFENKSKFILLHAGVTPTGTAARSTEALLSGLRIFLNLYPEAGEITKLLFVGPEDTRTMKSSEYLGLKSIVTHTGRVNYEDSLRLISSATVCVLIEHKMSEGIYFPSKLADYIVANKPIIAFSPAIGTVADMIEKGGITRIDYENEDAVSAAITKHYFKFKRNSMNELGPSKSLIRQVEAKAVCELFCRHAEIILRKSLSKKNSKNASQK